MTHTQLVSIVWLVYSITCFYFVRPIRTLSYRALLTIVPCVILILVGCHNLTYLHTSSVMIIAFYWILTIRLIHLIVLSPEKSSSLRSFAWEFIGIFIPIIRCESKHSVVFDLISGSVKLLLNHWIYRWFLTCEPSDSYARMAMFYVWVCTGTHVIDAQIALVRLVTRNRYTLLPFNNYPFLSKSIREFWSHRYNYFVHTLLKDSVFEPVRHMFSVSSAVAAWTTFFVSGLLHAHVAVSALGAPSPLPSLMFFLLQGIACFAEMLSPINLPRPIGILVTHIFLLVTAPLYAGLYTRAGPNFFVLNPPLLANAKWIPGLPVPQFCPK